MKRFPFMALATFALIAPASGCDLGGSERPSREGLLTRSPEGPQEDLNAIVGGVLELDLDRGCVLVAGKPVIWPAGTTLTTDPSELRLPGGQTARSGDTISSGGGAVPASGIRETSIGIEGDLADALECAPAHSAVLLLATRGGATVGAGSG